MIRDTVVDHMEPGEQGRENLEEMTVEGLTQIHSTSNPQTLFEVVLGATRNYTLSYVVNKNRREGAQKKEVVRNIDQLEKILESDIDNRKANKEYIEEVDKLEEINRKNLEKKEFIHRKNWILEGEKPTAFFFEMEKKANRRKDVTKLVVEEGEGASKHNVTYTEQADVREQIHKHFQQIFTEKEEENAEGIDEFLEPEGEDDPVDWEARERQKLNEEETRRMEADLQIEELDAVVKDLNASSSPGIDGYRGAWVQHFWPSLRVLFHRSVTYAFEKGLLSASQRQGIICLIPKGSDADLTLLGSLRPITLLSVFYKILSFAITNRLKNPLDRMIGPHQKAYIQGRFLGDVVKSTYDVMYEAGVRGLAGVILLVDFSKAFDSVSHTYIHKCLQWYGFGDHMTRWIKLLMTERTAVVDVSGHMTKTICLTRGVPQGDPISTHLFILAVDILVRKIVSMKEIKRLKIGCVIVDPELYADDLTIFAQWAERTLRKILLVLKRFGDLCGLKINRDKTKCVRIGSKVGSAERLCGDWELKWNVKIFTLLGIIFCNTLSRMYLLNIDARLTKMRGISGRWSVIAPTLVGRMQVIKTLMLSQIAHIVKNTIPDGERCDRNKRYIS